jgi:hypothetical protein
MSATRKPITILLVHAEDTRALFGTAVQAIEAVAHDHRELAKVELLAADDPSRMLVWEWLTRTEHNAALGEAALDQPVLVVALLRHRVGPVLPVSKHGLAPGGGPWRNTEYQFDCAARAQAAGRDVTVHVYQDSAAFALPAYMTPAEMARAGEEHDRLRHLLGSLNGNRAAEGPIEAYAAAAELQARLTQRLGHWLDKRLAAAGAAAPSANVAAAPSAAAPAAGLGGAGTGLGGGIDIALTGPRPPVPAASAVAPLPYDEDDLGWATAGATRPPQPLPASRRWLLPAAGAAAAIVVASAAGLWYWRSGADEQAKSQQCQAAIGAARELLGSAQSASALAQVRALAPHCAGLDAAAALRRDAETAVERAEQEALAADVALQRAKLVDALASITALESIEARHPQLRDLRERVAALEAAEAARPDAARPADAAPAGASPAATTPAGPASAAAAAARTDPAPPQPAQPEPAPKAARPERPAPTNVGRSEACREVVTRISLGQDSESDRRYLREHCK